ncbi:putative F-box domain-containing protein [Helianthus annuus]|uniref:F-box domain-containing protein n=1 Tax=Helianthus annuus TaxID=4232 RepID=A0A251UQY7_HELAN|nr:F-box protein At1g30790 [Helianthus annuus]KAF5824179.1 putative F-box domain-containing protein [Helianthus annuus]KAJ0576968.1 putative F-box domain-containing protein [Helianthus annuus]KAJ0584535.1 putative F-box domain-containing protein [Helianthus annuus]KAJ0750199.1 putative F-box domain-containing protein [Helianthus annuus]KAJ0918915.1 putative F-box domain-containing protein [Helianthus annuus]
METLEGKQAIATEAREDEHSTQKAKISFPVEIVEDILSRIPVKSILRFKSVSKPWLSLISGPSFHKLHSTVAPRTTALFFSAYDTSTNTSYFFSGARDGGSLANLMKLDNTLLELYAEHSNGLVCFTSRTYCFGPLYSYVLNPCTHKFFKLPRPPVNEAMDTCYLFGFDELSNEHKVLYFDVELIKPTTIEVMIFSISNYSWRKINVDLPVGMSRARWPYRTRLSVCVNSTIHLMLKSPLEILAFNLTTEKFSIFNIPPEAATLGMFVYPYKRNGCFIKINGLLGVAFYDIMGQNLHIWILQDYQNRVWVRETSTFPPNSQIRYGGGGPYPYDSISMDEIV